MRIKSIRIENFRSFQDETLLLNRYTCLVGPNGAGKSSVLAALNVFFREQSGAPTDISKLTDEDYFVKNTESPVRRNTCQYLMNSGHPPTTTVFMCS